MKISKYYLSKKDIYDCIMGAFLWRQTPQGNLFWSDIDNKLINLLNLRNAK